MEEAAAARWGTWEELVLGGAVLRHGTAAWDAVADELRSRTPSPFTPQECEAKYEDLQEQYSGCSAWFEELRKRRVTELRRELEKSEDSIGTLQSKLESLNAERGSSSSFEYDTRLAESPSPAGNADAIDSSCKETSRDGSSAGSYTGDTGRDWSEQCRLPASVSSQENDTGLDLREKSEKDMGGGSVLDIRQGICRKKRGQRKRKGSSIVKEASMGESSMVAIGRDPIGCDRDVGAMHGDSSGRVQCDDDTNLDLARIMDSIMEHKDVSIFQRRLESQKRARYKKMIRRHVDFKIISSRIGDGSISSSKELFRDLLLLANNALLFYPKNSEEHKSATALRDLVTKTLQDHSRSNPTAVNNVGAVSVRVGSKPAKLQSLHACSGSKVDGAPVLENGKRGGVDVGPAESSARKRGRGRAAKGGGGGRGGGKKQRASPSPRPNQGRKRARR